MSGTGGTAKSVSFSCIAYGSSEWREAVTLRETVLRIPLGSRFSPEELEEERDHVQVAGHQGTDLVATAVLVPEGDRMKMQRVVVLEALRDQGVGSALLAFCEMQARRSGRSAMYCHARNTAVAFYTRNGYRTEGGWFDEDGIPHLLMSKVLI